MLIGFQYQFWTIMMNFNFITILLHSSQTHFILKFTKFISMSFKFLKLIKNRKKTREREKGKRQVFKLHAKRVSSAYHFDFSREIYCVAKKKKNLKQLILWKVREKERNLHIHKKIVYAYWVYEVDGMLKNIIM